MNGLVNASITYEFKYYFNPKLIALSNSSLIITVRFLAFLVSLLNCHVLWRLKDPVFKKHLLVVSFADLVFTLSLALVHLFHNLNSSKPPHELNPYIYLTFLILSLALNDFFTSSLAVFKIVMELFLTVHRISVITSSWSYFKNIIEKKRVCLITLCLSMLIYSPVLFMKKVVYDYTFENQTSIKIALNLETTSFGATRFATLYISGLTLTRIVLVTIVLFTLNSILVVKLRSYVKWQPLFVPIMARNTSQSIVFFVKRERLSAELVRANRNSALMILLGAFLFMAANIPYSVYHLTWHAFQTRLTGLLTVSIVTQNMFIVVRVLFFAYFSHDYRYQLRKLFYLS